MCAIATTEAIELPRIAQAKFLAGVGLSHFASRVLSASGHFDNIWTVGVSTLAFTNVSHNR
jgi:hypothetical protein